MSHRGDQPQANRGDSPPDEQRDPQLQANRPAPGENEAENEPPAEARSAAAAESDSGGDPPIDGETELERERDSKLRAQAELENFRRRSFRELEEIRKYAVLPLARDLLPVIDNVGRALEAAEKSSEAGGLHEGVKMIALQLQNVLEQHQVRPIEAEGKPFDPNMHEAILQQESTEHPPGTVLMVTQPGYQLHDRVVRPSQVIVSKAPE